MFINYKREEIFFVKKFEIIPRFMIMLFKKKKTMVYIAMIEIIIVLGDDYKMCAVNFLRLLCNVLQIIY